MFYGGQIGSQSDAVKGANCLSAGLVWFSCKAQSNTETEREKLALQIYQLKLSCSLTLQLSNTLRWCAVWSKGVVNIWFQLSTMLCVCMCQLKSFTLGFSVQGCQIYVTIPPGHYCHNSWVYPGTSGHEAGIYPGYPTLGASPSQGIHNIVSRFQIWISMMIWSSIAAFLQVCYVVLWWSKSSSLNGHLGLLALQESGAVILHGW